MQTDRHQTDRRNAILRLLRGAAVRRQEDLVDLLKRDGFDVTQSSVSRDMRELGVIKAQGRYLPPDAAAAASMPGQFAAVARFVRSLQAAGPSITVVKTSVGAAGTVAAAIDSAEWPEVVGTISGDDTLFIATKDGAAQQRLVQRLHSTFGI
jgi:transcriptional regulator of arginine metabolism